MLYICSMITKEVMAICNVTPDSFYCASRLMDAPSIADWAIKSLNEGASILDIGGCSTRPGSTAISEQEEWERLSYALSIIRDATPSARLSIDTFRPVIVRRALEQFGELIVNDISGGEKSMYEIVHYWGVPYIWTLRGDMTLPSKRAEMCSLNLILDPGFGFTGSISDDYTCLRQMNTLQEYGKPILVGLSRKSMLYSPLGITAEASLSATQVAQFYALEQGADILRTHDVKETMQTITLYNLLRNNN